MLMSELYLHPQLHQVTFLSLSFPLHSLSTITVGMLMVVVGGYVVVVRMSVVIVRVSMVIVRVSMVIMCVSMVIVDLLFRCWEVGLSTPLASSVEHLWRFVIMAVIMPVVMVAVVMPMVAVAMVMVTMGMGVCPGLMGS